MQRSVPQYMGIIMTRQKIQVNAVLEMVEVLNSSVLACKDLVVIFESVFNNEKSNRILLAVQVLQYCVKNCNKNFHLTANSLPLQKSILSLLKRVRGKSSFLKDITSNKDNWYKIQAKVLYLIQLWYDTFILEEAKYNHIINNYKILRKQNVTFPPRNANQRNLIYVETQSPIFDNIQVIARHDQQKFSKKLTAMGLNQTKQKLQMNIQKIEEKKPVYINIDDISEKIAILQSQDNSNPTQMLRVIESVRRDIEFGKVKPNQQQYWQQIKQAADKLIYEQQTKNSQSVQSEQQKYLERKLNFQNKRQKVQQHIQIPQRHQPVKEQNKVIQQQINLLDL